MAPLRFVSTRDGSRTVSFKDALLQGLAPDGGLFVPQQVPVVAPEVWKESRSLAELAAQVLPLWTEGDLDPAAAASIARDALDFDAPLVPLSGPWQGVHVLELFHGPTLSFKDFGARTMARLMGHFLRQEGKELLILVATSGDTGSAVADGFAGQENIRVALLYPEGQVSPVQERQLIAKRPGVRAFSVRGTFDDCQRLVKEAFVDPDLQHLNLSSANSINIGRLVPQSLYYMWAVAQGGFDRVNICVPSGNLGNVTGGVFAALGGLPVEHFIAAHNANDFFPRYLVGEADDFMSSRRTLSNAMDVGAPSNFERLQAIIPRERLTSWFRGMSVSDDETLGSMRRVYEETGYLADPHTAVGLEGARRYRDRTNDGLPIIVLSTAHPAKFPETIRQALGFEPETPPALAAYWQMPTEVTPIDPTLEAFREELGW